MGPRMLRAFGGDKVDVRSGATMSTRAPEAGQDRDRKEHDRAQPSETPLAPPSARPSADLATDSPVHGADPSRSLSRGAEARRRRRTKTQGRDPRTSDPPDRQA